MVDTGAGLYPLLPPPFVLQALLLDALFAIEILANRGVYQPARRSVAVFAQLLRPAAGAVIEF